MRWAGKKHALSCCMIFNVCLIEWKPWQFHSGDHGSSIQADQAPTLKPLLRRAFVPRLPLCYMYVCDPVPSCVHRPCHIYMYVTDSPRENSRLHVCLCHAMRARFSRFAASSVPHAGSATYTNRVTSARALEQNSLEPIKDTWLANLLSLQRPSTPFVRPFLPWKLRSYDTLSICLENRTAGLVWKWEEEEKKVWLLGF